MNALRDLIDRHPIAFRPIRRPLLALFHRFAGREARAVEKVIASMARLVVEDPCIAVQEFQGAFYVDVRSALFRRVITDGHYEPELSRLCVAHCNPDRDVLDVGANIGFHAVLFGKTLNTGRVLCIEPTARAFERLQKNIAANGVAARVIAIRGALSDSAGESELMSVTGQEEFSSLGAMAHPAIQGKPVSAERVSVRTLDEIVAEHRLNPSFIKIDVEGYEHRVLSGARRVLADYRPVVLAELSDPLLRANGSSAHEVVAMMEQMDYRVSDPVRPHARPGTREYGDVLCLPQ